MTPAPGTPVRPGPVLGAFVVAGHAAGVAVAVACLPLAGAIPVVGGLALSLLVQARRLAAPPLRLRTPATGMPVLVDGEGRQRSIRGTVLHPWAVVAVADGAAPVLLTADGVPEAGFRPLRRALLWAGTRRTVESVAEAAR